MMPPDDVIVDLGDLGLNSSFPWNSLGDGGSVAPAWHNLPCRVVVRIKWSSHHAYHLKQPFPTTLCCHIGILVAVTGLQVCHGNFGEGHLDG